jgi:hypothetical protein
MNAEITRSSSLFAIVDAILADVDITDDGELTEETLTRLDALNVSLEQKVEAYHHVYEELRAKSAANRAREAECAARARAAANAADRLRERLQQQMERMEVTQLKGLTVRACVHPSTESAEVIDGTPIECIPPEFVITDRRVSTKLVRDALKAGRVLPWARLTRGQHVRFR